METPGARGVVCALVIAGCSRADAPSRADGASALRAARSTPEASGLLLLPVRVPAALTIARAIDTLSVAVDPASLGLTQVAVDPGMVIGVEADLFVFARGQARPITERHRIGPSADFGVGAGTWSTREDGVPVQGTKYVVEMQIVLFETDVSPGHDWDPGAGRYKPLWSRTLRQAEE